MATTNWRSSLGNIETRLRRSLGLSGPTDLLLEPRLTPVIIADDATRPGSSSSLRGRRWKVRLNPGSILVGNNGSVWLYQDSPAAGSGQRTDTYAGGSVIDWIEVKPICPAAVATIVYIALYWFPTDLVLNPGIPVAVTNPNVFFTDPMRTSTERAGLAIGLDPAMPAGTNGGVLVWEEGFRCDGVSRARIPADIFLNWNSCISLGNTQVGAPAQLDLHVNIHGRIY